MDLRPAAARRRGARLLSARLSLESGPGAVVITLTALARPLPALAGFALALARLPA
jgi:hypothetical protein